MLVFYKKEYYNNNAVISEDGSICTYAALHRKVVNLSNY